MAKWMVSVKKADFGQIGEKFGIDPVIARIIRNRNIITEEEIAFYLQGTLADLHDPKLLPDIEQAVSFLLSEIEKNASIRIIGDYDIDGICASYILLQGLRASGASVDTVIPHRIRDGYGLNDSLIEDAAHDGIDLIITCDNGIAAAKQIEYAKQFGMRVIVTDHHEVPYEIMQDGSRRELLPEAQAVIDPKRQDSIYPYDGICGAVVAYKFVQVLFEKAGIRNEELFSELLEFAAFATVGDVMELLDENRILVRFGLKQMVHTKNLGLKALIEVNGLQDKELSAFHIGFVLGPCLNATGRLDTAGRALELLTCEDFGEAVRLAGELKALNDSRKEMTGRETGKAITMIEEGSLSQDKVLVVYLPECHESLAGIIAGRIRERYYKPVFVLTKGEEGIKGSGRSIEAYHMYEQMSLCKDLFSKYGGHKMAAGLSLPEENIEIFRKRLNENCTLTDEDFVEKILIDVPMPFSYITRNLIGQLKLLEPFGNGNARPVFARKSVYVTQGRILGKNGNVGKYKIKDETGRLYDMIYFGDLEKWHAFLVDNFGLEQQKKLYQTGTDKICIHMIYYPEINVYQGRESLQIVMQDYASI